MLRRAIYVVIGVIGAAGGAAVLLALIGWMLPVKHTASRTVTLNAPPEQVFDLMSDFMHAAAWRDGVFPFHHYHSNAHEALGIYSGEVTVLFGGDAGVTVTARPGDVVVLPAGTGHKKLSATGTLGVVGAYPAGAHPDTCMLPFSSSNGNTANVAQVPLPADDFRC